MPYPDQFPTLTFETVGSLRIVDLVSHLPTRAGASYQTRDKWAIRKVLIHHHAGAPKGTEKFDAKGADAGVPKSCIQTAKFFTGDDDPATKDKEGKEWPGYAYHYDIGYDAHTDGGFDYAMRTQAETVNSHHTGAGQNEMGVSISHFGSLREFWNPKGQYKTGTDGRPSDFQRRVFPQVVKYLQDKHSISNLHVQAHFQHGKPACPGWDLEYWIMHHEDKPRKDGKGFCWPINPDGGNAAAFIPNDTTKAIPQAKKLVANNLSGGSGFYPISRRYTWHDGIHLFGAAGQAVRAVHDGWVVGARVTKNVKDEKSNDFGSANFVLILHEDPGLVDLLDSRTHVKKDLVPIPIRYFSLYMHLAPLEYQFEWLEKLYNRDPQRFADLTHPGTAALNLSGVAIPVKAGEIIGVIGKHNPFAARPATATAAKAGVYDAAKHNLLHFEVFSSSNLLQLFHPDPALHKAWTIEDPNANVYADEFVARLEKITGILPADTAAYKAAAANADKADPQQQDASAWTKELTPALNNTLSKVVAKHVSEWSADFDKVIDKRAKDWGLDADAKKSTKKMVGDLKWWAEVYKNTGVHKAKQTFLPAGSVSHHYHPVRILCWLAGLRRTLDHLPTGGVDSAGFPLSTNIYADLPDTNIKSVRAAAAAGSKDILLDKGHVEDRLKGSSVRFENHDKVYDIDSYSKVMNKTVHVEWKVSLRQGLAEALTKSTKYKLGNYGWHFEADFDWNTDLSS